MWGQDQDLYGIIRQDKMETAFTKKQRDRKEIFHHVVFLYCKDSV